MGCFILPHVDESHNQCTFTKSRPFHPRFDTAQSSEAYQALQDEEVIQAFSRVGAPVASNPAHGSGAPAGGSTGVTAVRVVRDGKTNVGKGFAFVEFATPAAARMALALNGTEVCVPPTPCEY